MDFLRPPPPPNNSCILYVHLSHELLLRFWAQVAVHCRLDFEQVLDYVLEVVYPSLVS